MIVIWRCSECGKQIIMPYDYGHPQRWLKSRPGCSPYYRYGELVPGAIVFCLGFLTQIGYVAECDGYRLLVREEVL